MKEQNSGFPFVKAKLFKKINILFMLFFILYPLILMAGDPPPPPDHTSTENVPGGGAEIYTGLSIFLLLALLYFILKMKVLKFSFLSRIHNLNLDDFYILIRKY